MALLVQLPAPQAPPLPSFDVSPVLDGVTYTLRFIWNTRDEGWRLRVLDEPGQRVLVGDTRVVADWPLYPSRVVRTPAGLLLVRDTSGRGQDPGLSDLGSRARLWYETAAEVLAILGG